MKPEQADTYARTLADLAKYSLIIIVVVGAIYFLSKKLGDVTFEEIKNAFFSIPPFNIFLAVVLTCANFCLLTGYDLIAVRYLKKELPVKNVMAGAILGYAMSNVFGWILGGTAVRYRLYRRWGFTPVEIVAFVTILSITFWLGMFLLAGLAFAVMPIHLPEKFEGALFFHHRVWGWIFLAIVAAYLVASAFIRKPIRWKSYRYALPPLSLSILQLIVSAGDFVLASAVLYVVIPPDLTGPDTINFSTILASYLTAMVIVVATHAPGGVGVLEATIVSVFPDNATASIFAAVLMFRLIYYILPAIFAGILWSVMEASWSRERRAINVADETS